MALCRCIDHSPPIGRAQTYFRSVEPLGYPNSTSSLCGRKKCKNDGVIWLTKEEYKDYESGEKIFPYATAVTKVKVK